MDLMTRYLGLSLKNPLVAGASPLCGDAGNIRNLEDASAAAVVLPSLFEEQIEEERRVVGPLTSGGADSYGEALSYFASSA